MKLLLSFVAAASLLVLGGIANADDHLLNAQERGLSPEGNAINHTNAFDPDHFAPGQGSPFFGDETHTPSSEVASEKHPDKIKERGLK